jgi:hypothetical protein
VNFRRLRTGLGLVAFFLVAAAGASVAQVGTNPNAPPPPPLPVINQNATNPSTSTPLPAAAPAVTAAPLASPSPAARPRRGHKAPASTPSPDVTDTPAPPEFKTLDGIWEIELQPIGHRLANYQHFSIVQTGNTLSGYWEHDPNRTKSPITGTFDGRLIQISADVKGGTVTFGGYVENMGDIVGMQHLAPGDVGIAFTAQHRKKEKS